ncbi:hypothetical protein VNO78_25558 [Psophocarpus tetragonolobus]|uniref:Uncharacterized protein n=1 Tax=Psophocarpus tetragonolobus TaxID=3891 RepID=A0AAN9S637_PSOTE
MQTREPCTTNLVSPITNTVVIGSEYCVPFPTGLEIVRTLKTFPKLDEFAVKDVHGNTVFNLQRPSFSAHNRCLLHDNAGNPIVTLRKKRMTAHNRWQIFRGKSDQINDLLFSVKRPSVFQLLMTTLELEVFLAKNKTTEEKVYDFKVEGSWSNGSCDVYSVQSSNIIAQMAKHDIQTTGSENFVVKVEANVDSAFIVALIVILSLE